MKTRLLCAGIPLLLAGCLTYPGKIRPSLPAGENFVMLPRPISLVSGKTYDCGAESFHGVMCYYQQPADFRELADSLTVPGAQGTFPQKLAQVAGARGYEVRTVDGTFQALRESIDAGIPAIVLIRSSSNSNHFLLATGYQPDKELAIFEFFDGWKWIFTKAELEEAWRPCGFLQLEFVLSPQAAKLSKARNLESQGELEEALLLYREILKDDPGNLYARLGAGNCLVQDGSSREAREEYLLAFEGGLRDPELLNNLADLGLENGVEDDRALGWAEASVAGFETRLDQEASVLGKGIWSRKLVSALGTLGAAQQARGNNAAARQSFLRSLDLLGDRDAEIRRRRLEQIAACGG